MYLFVMKQMLFLYTGKKISTTWTWTINQWEKIAPKWNDNFFHNYNMANSAGKPTSILTIPIRCLPDKIFCDVENITSILTYLIVVDRITFSPALQWWVGSPFSPAWQCGPDHHSHLIDNGGPDHHSHLLDNGEPDHHSLLLDNGGPDHHSHLLDNGGQDHHSHLFDNGGPDHLNGVVCHVKLHEVQGLTHATEHVHDVCELCQFLHSLVSHGCAQFAHQRHNIPAVPTHGERKASNSIKVKKIKIFFSMHDKNRTHLQLELTSISLIFHSSYLIWTIKYAFTNFHK